MVQEANLLWQAAGGAGGMNVLFFRDDATVSQINTTVQNFLTAIRGALATTTTAALSPEIKQRDTATGILTGTANVASPANIIGNGGATAVPNVAQGLLRLRTGVVIGRRELKGRIFIPGMASSMGSAAGELTPSAITLLQAGGTALVFEAPMVVWHRPVGGAGGASHPVFTTSVWGEFASQRRRRS